MHDFIQAGANHFLYRAVLALTNTGNAVSDRKLAGQLRRPAGHELADRGVIVAFLQYGTDTNQGELHGDVEIGRSVRAERIRVRIDGRRVGVHERLENVTALVLVGAIESVCISLGERFANGCVGLAAQLQTQPVAFYALAPKVVALGFRLWPGRLVAQYGIVFLRAEIEVLFKQVARVVHAVDNALPVYVEDLERDLQILLFDSIVDLTAIRHETVDVRLQEKHAIRIE
ncbi:hypothetical protein D9M72_526710 [compost metagenome]